jgi:O-antigen/teichoic acid export membrane protein
MSKRTWAIQTLYNVIEYGGVRFLDAVTTLILIRVLSLNEFGIFSFYQSVVSIILLFLPQPIMVLFRRYGELKKNNELEKALYSYF